MPLAKQLRFKSVLTSVKLVGVAIAASSLLAGCGGGGGGSSEQSTPTTRVIAFGDSLTDSGVYGGKYIVNNATAFGEGSNSIWVDSISQALGVDEPCPFFRHDGAGDEYLRASYTTSPSCANFAVGAGRINARSATAAAAAGLAAAASPRSIPAQLATAAGVLTYSSGDLVLISASGNDAVDLFSGLATLLAASDPAAVNAVLTSVSSIDAQLIARTVQASILEELAELDGRTQLEATLDGTLKGYVRLSAAYLAGLAVGLKDQVTSNLLDRGASKVVVQNMPNVLATPAFQALIAGAGLSAEQTATAEAVIADLVGVYNVQLASVFAGDPRVIVYDLYSLTNEATDVSGAEALGFTNTTFPSCGAVSAHLCSEQIASATVFVGVGASADWQSFLWADALHPGELAHDVVAERLISLLAARGWR